MEIKDVVSSNGKLIATSSSDGKIKLWEAGTGQEKATLRAYKAGIVMDAFSSDGKTLASCSANRIKLWNLATFREIATFPLTDETVWFIDFTGC